MLFFVVQLLVTCDDKMQLQFYHIFITQGYYKNFLQSFYFASLTTIISVIISIFAAYAFAFMDFKGKNFLFMMVVASMIIPLQMSLIPLVQLFKSGIELGGITLIPALDTAWA